MDEHAERLRARRDARAAEIRRRRRGTALAGLAGVAVLIGAILLLTRGGGRGGATLPTAGRRAPRARLTTASTPKVQPTSLTRLAATGLPVYCGGTTKPMVALTFDDGPGPYTTLAIKKLRQHHLRATFFLVGKSINSYPSLARLEQPVAAVGDHTMTHPFLPGLSEAAMVAQIADARTLIETSSRQPVELFRPPYGAHTPAVDAEARSLGLVEVLWTVDSADSLGADYAGIARNVIGGLRPGSIILMHENRGQTIRALATIIPALARSHLKAVTVPELLSADPPTMAQLRAGGLGCGGRRTAGSGA